MAVYNWHTICTYNGLRYGLRTLIYASYLPTEKPSCDGLTKTSIMKRGFLKKMVILNFEAKLQNLNQL